MSDSDVELILISLKFSQKDRPILVRNPKWKDMHFEKNKKKYPELQFDLELDD